MGMKISDYLSQAFSEIFEINFTANLEDELDLIARGEKEAVEVLREFYQPFSLILNREMNKNEYINIEEKTGEKCPKCGHELMFRYSRFGKFYACSNYPQCKFTKPFFEKINKKCPKCGGEMIVKYTKKKKKFYACFNYPKCDFAAWKISQI